jgi:hypothetical protein
MRGAAICREGSEAALCCGSGRPIGGDASGIESSVDRGLITGHDGHTEALHQKRSRFNRAEVGAGNKQQIIGEIGQLFLGKGLSALPTV